MNPGRRGFNGRGLLPVWAAALIGLTALGAFRAPAASPDASATDHVLDMWLPLRGALPGSDLPEKPHPEIPLGSWARHGRAITAWGGAMLLLSILCLRVLRRPRTLVQPAPGAVAVRALQALVTPPPQDTRVLGEVCRILKHYASGALALPPWERTTTEMNDAVSVNVPATDAPAVQLIAFLQACDARRFAPSASDLAFDAVARALSLVRAMETANERTPADSDDAVGKAAV